MNHKNLFLGLLLSLGLTLACGDGDDDDHQHGDGSDTQDSSGNDASDDASGSDCYENPTTHLEIINACTDAERLTVELELPLLNDDGTLPELP